jgi:acyl-CoA reductase-like NAD-dependent aldehyde dehydrogenase
VVEGGVDEVTELLKASWGKVCFTGSERVGKIVAQATAKTLTPTLLELGGKSPVLVDETAPDDIASVANRIMWGKTFNAGQTCIAPDFVLCHEKHATALCRELVMTIARQFGKNPKQSELGRIVSKDHAQRLVDMMKEVERNSFPLCGGSEKCNVDDKYVCPTVLLSPPRDCRLMKEEIFGPVLPVIIVKSRQEAINFIQQQNGTPLALYVFTKSKTVYQEVVRACPSGGACRNDTMLHGGSSCLPFGGLGTSGYGNYHGRFSFDTFTHAFGSIYRPCFPGSDFSMVRYHPYAGLKQTILVHVLGNLPYIPVLHVRIVATVLFVVLAVQYIPAFESLRLETWQLVGRTLQAIADWALLHQ